MSDPDELLRIGKPTLELMLREAEKVGYQKAINALMSMEADGLHEMYASGFGDWLAKKKSEIFN